MQQQSLVLKRNPLIINELPRQPLIEQEPRPGNI
jgi:hypothetical protein